MPKNGIFCIEGPWDPNLKKRLSVKPILDLLTNYGGDSYIYRDCATREELYFYLKQWKEKK